MDHLSPRDREDAAARLRALLLLALPGLEPGHLQQLRAAFGAEWPADLPPRTELGTAYPPADPARAARAVRESLAAPRQPGLAALTAAARAAGALDAALALDLLEQARPARVLPALLAGATGREGPLTSRLEQLVAKHLGPDPQRWSEVQGALATHRGTLPDLLAEDLPPAVEGRSAPPRAVYAALALLLGHADPRDLADVLPHLDDTTVTELLAGGSQPPARLVEAVTAYGDSRTRAALARHPRLDARVLRQLVTADDPAVNAVVYRNPRATPSLRRAIAAGTPYTPGRTQPVPVDRVALLGRAPTGRPALAPLVGSGDPELTRLGLSLGVRRQAQQYALLRVWERHGSAAVRGLLDDPALARGLHPKVVALVAGALDDPDGCRRLRADCEAYEAPATLVRRLQTTRGTDTLRDLLHEPYAHDIEALAAGHRASPYLPRVAEELLRHEDATDEQRTLFRTTVLNDLWRQGERIEGVVTPPGERLAEGALDQYSRSWAPECVRAGLLDPALLVTAARPALEAVMGLGRLAEDDGLPAAVTAQLAALAGEWLAGRPEVWEVLLEALPEFPGTLAELLAHAEQAADRAAPAPATLSAVPAALRAAEPFEPPTEPVGRDHRAALGAIDLLITLGKDTPGLVPPPVPGDPGVLAFLARTDSDDYPGWIAPRWLVEARGSDWAPDPETFCEAPEPELLLEAVRVHALRMGGGGSFSLPAQLADLGYLNGVVTAEALLAAIPARFLIPVTWDWQDAAFVPAVQRALGDLLREELGTDAPAWIRLLTAAQEHAENTDLSWPELVELSRTVSPRPERVTPSGTGSAEEFDRTRVRYWGWPAGEALLRADAGVLAAVLPQLRPHASRLLALYLNVHHERYPQPVLQYLVTHGDHGVVDELAQLRHEPLEEREAAQLLGRADPLVNLALLRHHPDYGVRHRAAVHPAGGLAAYADRIEDHRLAKGLQAPEPDLIEAVFARTSGWLRLPEQLIGCLGMLRHGGPERLAALLDSGQVGPGATRICRKALAAPDTLAALQSRTAREFRAEKLLARLRGLDHAYYGYLVPDLLTLPYEVDWALLEAEHARQPFAVWAALVAHPDAPEEFVLRHHEALGPVVRWRQQESPVLTRARMHLGFGHHHGTSKLTVRLDQALATGRLTGLDLVHLIAPAAQVLRYLVGALLRPDGPSVQLEEATGELVALMRKVDGPAAWQRIYAALTGRDQGWEPLSSVAQLLEGPGGDRG